MDNLSKPELLTLLSIMEGELEARDLVIEALRVSSVLSLVLSCTHQRAERPVDGGGRGILWLSASLIAWLMGSWLSGRLVFCQNGSDGQICCKRSGNNPPSYESAGNQRFALGKCQSRFYFLCKDSLSHCMFSLGCECFSAIARASSCSAFTS